jgi:hypothetical protein
MRASFYDVPEQAWLFRQAAREVRETEPAAMPEEQVRQWCLHELIRAYGVSVCRLEIERAVKVARERKPNRIDILILNNGKPYIVIECKARGETQHEAAINQALSYASLPDVNAEFAVYTNGEVWWVRRRVRGQWIEVPDIPMLQDDKPTDDWRDVLLAVDCIAPVLYWIDNVVPAKVAPRYFGALQAFFHATNEVTAATDRRLLWTADHILRVLDDVGRHPEYTGGKLSHACDGLNKYWKERGVEPSFGGGDLWQMAHHAWANLSNLLDGARDMVSLDYQAMRVIQALFDYLNGMKGPRGQYKDVGAAVQSEVRAYIDLSLTVRFNARLPDIQDKILIGDVRELCKPAWVRHMKKDEEWDPGLLRACLSFWVQRAMRLIGFRVDKT